MSRGKAQKKTLAEEAEYHKEYTDLRSKQFDGTHEGMSATARLKYLYRMRQGALFTGIVLPGMSQKVKPSLASEYTVTILATAKSIWKIIEYAPHAMRKK